MATEEQIEIVKAHGLPEATTGGWAQKFKRHKALAAARGLQSHLTFDQYIQKVVEAGMTSPHQHGLRKGQLVLGRVGDEGDYEVERCRFITTEQNLREGYDNGKHVNGIKRRAQGMIGQTKENSEWVRKISERLTGRTKETHSSYAALAVKLAKDFILIDPNGVEHRGSNVKEFCQGHGLNVFAIYSVFAGRRNHHQHWTGHYV